MYYEEKLLAGVWYWRGTPNGEWKMFTSLMLHEKIRQLQQQVDELERRLDLSAVG